MCDPIAILEQQVTNLTHRVSDLERACAGLICILSAANGKAAPAGLQDAVKTGQPVRATFTTNDTGGLSISFEPCATN